MMDEVLNSINQSLPQTLQVKSVPGMKGKQGEGRILVIFKASHMNNHINGELSMRPFH